MELIVLTPEKEIFSGSIKSVKVPGVNGQFEILTGHAPIVSSLVKGEIRIITSDGNKQNYSISKGFVEVLRDEVSLLVQNSNEKDN